MESASYFEDIMHYFIAVEKEELKMEVLLDLVCNLDINQGVIYCNTSKRALEIEKTMNDHDFTVSAIHHVMDQIKRDSIIKEFKAGTTRVLITTDFLGRSLNVRQVGLIINYELPFTKEHYNIRITRITGAMGFVKKGVIINFVLPNDAKFIREIQDYYNYKIEEMPQDLEDLDTAG